MTRKLGMSLMAWLVLVAGVRSAEPEITIQRDIVFGKGGDVDLKLDLARPPKGEGPFPLVVCIHGGAWQLGNRTAHHRTVRLLAAHVYVAATVRDHLRRPDSARTVPGGAVQVVS